MLDHPLRGRHDVLGSSPRDKRPASARKRTRRKPRAGKLTPEVRQKLIEALRAGNFVSVSARYAGIHPNTFRRWMRRGQESSRGIYREFYLEVKQAETYAEVVAVASIHKHMKENWRAAIAYLERKFPMRWTTRKDAAGSAARSRRAVPQALRLQHDAEFLGEVAEVLDRAGAIESVTRQSSFTEIDERDPAPADAQASSVPAIG